MNHGGISGGGIKRITSSGNAAVKEAAKLGRKRGRYERRRFLAEGEDLLEEGLRNGAVPRQVFVLEGSEDRLGEALAAVAAASDRPEIFLCGAPVMARLSELGSGSRVISVFPFLDRRLPEERPAQAGARGSALPGPLLYLAGAGDPGNVGSLIRSAAALGARGVILGPETADPYSPKALRATMGSIFQLPVYLGVAAGVLAEWTAGLDLELVCADSRQGMPVWDADLSGSFVLALGAERGGVPGRLKAAARQIVRIPLVPDVESVNVAMAGTAVLYEALRQRSAG